MSKKYYVNQNTNRIRKTKFNDSDIYKNLNKKNFTYNKNYSQTEKEIDKSFVNENLKENKKSFKSSFLGWIKSIFIFIFTNRRRVLHYAAACICGVWLLVPYSTGLSVTSCI